MNSTDPLDLELTPTSPIDIAQILEQEHDHDQ